MYRFFLKYLILFVTMLLCCCGTCPTPPQDGAYDQMRFELRKGIASNQTSNKKTPYIPRSVSNALIPAMPAAPRLAYSDESEHRFNVSADKVQAKSFFMGLVAGTPYNMIVNPNVQGVITLELKNVTILEVMDAVRDVYGYDYHRTSYGYEVSPPEIQSQLFTVNYLDVKRSGKSLTQMTSGDIAQQLGSGTNPNQPSNTSNISSQQSGTSTSANFVPTSSVDTTSEMNFWKSLSATLKTMVGDKDGRSVAVNAQSGIVIVRAYPAELRKVARYLDRIQSNLNRQVILEAKILEVRLNDQFQSGVDWNLFGKGLISNATTFDNNGGVNQTSFDTFDNTRLKDFKSIFALNIKGDFGALVKLLQTQGNVQVLSSPRIATVNNQKAVIKVGQDEFFVTGVSSTTAVAGNTTIPSQNVTLTPFFSGITLDVTPQISRGGNIILHIHPTVSEVRSQVKDLTVGQVIGTNAAGASTAVPNTLSLPLALSTVRESDNIVRARNNQIIVIGGLMQNNMAEEIAGTPVLSKIPFVGVFFRRTQQISVKTELVILLRPIITNKKVWRNDLRETDEGFSNLNRGYHLGGLPEVFGTEGETENAQQGCATCEGGGTMNVTPVMVPGEG